MRRTLPQLSTISRYNWPTKQCTRIVADYKQSRGSTLVDENNRRYLDMYGSIASLPLGYNHPVLLNLVKSVHPSILIHKPATGFFPPMEYPRLLDSIIKMSTLPHDMFFTMATGSEAVENAIKLAYLRQIRHKQLCSVRGTSMKVLSLETGFHGRTLGALSATHSKSGYKDSFPTFSWLKLPIGDSKQTLKRLEYYLEREDLAACIIEPIQAEGGDVHLDYELARTIREMLSKHNVPLIVDEVQTGLGATGKMWAHQWWELKEHGLDPPEFITVSKKTQQSGIFFFKEDIPKQYYQVFNTWLGNPWDLKKFETILKIIHNDVLLFKVNNVGAYLKSELRHIGDPIYNVRGKGTMIAFDVKEPLNNKLMVETLENNGAIVGMCGTNSVRLRPPLTIGRKDVDMFMRILVNTLDQLDESVLKGQSPAESGSFPSPKTHGLSTKGDSVSVGHAKSGSFSSPTASEMPFTGDKIPLNESIIQRENPLNELD